MHGEKKTQPDSKSTQSMDATGISLSKGKMWVLCAKNGDESKMITI